MTEVELLVQRHNDIHAARLKMKTVFDALGEVELSVFRDANSKLVEGQFLHFDITGMLVYTDQGKATL